MKKAYFVLVLVMSLMQSCSKDNESAPVKVAISGDRAYNLVCGDSIQLKVADTSDGIVWQSANTDIATVNSTGKVKVIRVGETYIKAIKSSSIDSIKISTSGKYSTYKEPVRQFGISSSQVKYLETRKLLYQNTSGVLYQGENSAITYITYLFENDKLVGSSVTMNGSGFHVDVTAFLFERYTYLTYSNSIALFTDKKGISIGLSFDKSMNSQVMYMVDPAFKSSSLVVDKFEKMRRNTETIIQQVK